MEALDGFLCAIFEQLGGEACARRSSPGLDVRFSANLTSERTARG